MADQNQTPETEKDDRDFGEKSWDITKKIFGLLRPSRVQGFMNRFEENANFWNNFQKAVNTTGLMPSEDETAEPVKIPTWNGEKLLFSGNMFDYGKNDIGFGYWNPELIDTFTTRAELQNEDLDRDPGFVQASQIIYKMFEKDGADPQYLKERNKLNSDQIEFLRENTLSKLAWIETNTFSSLKHIFRDVTPVEGLAMAYATNAKERTTMTGSDFFGHLWRTVVDPTNYPSVLYSGMGGGVLQRGVYSMFGKDGAKILWGEGWRQFSKEKAYWASVNFPALKNVAKELINQASDTGVTKFFSGATEIAALEAGVATAQAPVFDITFQKIKIDGHQQENHNYWQTAFNTLGTGASAGVLSYLGANSPALNSLAFDEITASGLKQIIETRQTHSTTGWLLMLSDRFIKKQRQTTTKTGGKDTIGNHVLHYEGKNGEEELFFNTFLEKIQQRLGKAETPKAEKLSELDELIKKVNKTRQELLEGTAKNPGELTKCVNTLKSIEEIEKALRTIDACAEDAKQIDLLEELNPTPKIFKNFSDISEKFKSDLNALDGANSQASQTTIQEIKELISKSEDNFIWKDLHYNNNSTVLTNRLKTIAENSGSEEIKSLVDKYNNQYVKVVDNYLSDQFKQQITYLKKVDLGDGKLNNELQKILPNVDSVTGDNFKVLSRDLTNLSDEIRKNNNAKKAEVKENVAEIFGDNGPLKKAREEVDRQIEAIADLAKQNDILLKESNTRAISTKIYGNKEQMKAMGFSDDETTYLTKHFATLRDEMYDEQNKIKAKINKMDKENNELLEKDPRYKQLKKKANQKDATEKDTQNMRDRETEIREKIKSKHGYQKIYEKSLSLEKELKDLEESTFSIGDTKTVEKTSEGWKIVDRGNMPKATIYQVIEQTKSIQDNIKDVTKGLEGQLDFTDQESALKNFDAYISDSSSFNTKDAREALEKLTEKVKDRTVITENVTKGQTHLSKTGNDIKTTLKRAEELAETNAELSQNRGKITTFLLEIDTGWRDKTGEVVNAPKYSNGHVNILLSQLENFADVEEFWKGGTTSNTASINFARKIGNYLEGEADTLDKHNPSPEDVARLQNIILDSVGRASMLYEAQNAVVKADQRASPLPTAFCDELLKQFGNKNALMKAVLTKEFVEGTLNEVRNAQPLFGIPLRRALLSQHRASDIYRWGPHYASDVRLYGPLWNLQQQVKAQWEGFNTPFYYYNETYLKHSPKTIKRLIEKPFTKKKTGDAAKPKADNYVPREFSTGKTIGSTILGVPALGALGMTGHLMGFRGVPDPNMRGRRMLIDYAGVDDAFKPENKEEDNYPFLIKGATDTQKLILHEKILRGELSESQVMSLVGNDGILTGDEMATVLGITKEMKSKPLTTEELAKFTKTEQEAISKTTTPIIKNTENGKPQAGGTKPQAGGTKPQAAGSTQTTTTVVQSTATENSPTFPVTFNEGASEALQKKAIDAFNAGTLKENTIKFYAGIDKQEGLSDSELKAMVMAMDKNSHRQSAKETAKSLAEQANEKLQSAWEYSRLGESERVVKGTETGLNGLALLGDSSKHFATDIIDNFASTKAGQETGSLLASLIAAFLGGTLTNKAMGGGLLGGTAGLAVAAGAFMGTHGYTRTALEKHGTELNETRTQSLRYQHTAAASTEAPASTEAADIIRKIREAQESAELKAATQYSGTGSNGFVVTTSLEHPGNAMQGSGNFTDTAKDIEATIITTQIAENDNSLNEATGHNFKTAAGSSNVYDNELVLG